jgi:D-methionine transport system permease protein
MQDQLIDLLLTGTVDTLIMVGASAFIAFLIGLPIAVILVSTSEHFGIYPSKRLIKLWAGSLTLLVLFPF